jgi:hypothetical protein
MQYGAGETLCKLEAATALCSLSSRRLEQVLAKHFIRIEQSLSCMNSGGYHYLESEPRHAMRTGEPG